MIEPHGFEQHDQSSNILACELHKALYGLTQALRDLFER